MKQRSSLGLAIATATLVTSCEPRRVEGPRDQLEASLHSTLAVAGVLASGERSRSHRLPMGQPSSVTLIVWSPADLEVELLLPDSSRLVTGRDSRDDRRITKVFLDETPGLLVPGVGKGYNTLLTLSTPPAGIYEVRVNAARSVAERTPYTITALPASDVRLGVALPQPEVLRGGALVIAALFFDNDRPVDRARVSASIARESAEGTAPARPLAIELRDEGKEPDAKANDGIFSALFVPEHTGRHVVAVTGRGMAGDMEVQRNAGGTFVVSERTVELTGSYRFEGVDLDDDRRFDVLRAEVGVETEQPGRYELTGVLRAANGKDIETQRLIELADGRQMAVLDFPASSVQSLGVDGPYQLRLIRVDELTRGERLLRETAWEPARTRGLRLQDFAEGGGR